VLATAVPVTQGVAWVVLFQTNTVTSSMRHATDITQLLQWLPGYLQKQLGVIKQPLRHHGICRAWELEPRELNHDATRAVLRAFDLTS
jgi:hypothetical protein